jgi:hypothetical protein
VERRRLCVYFVYLALRLWKSVVTFAVTGNTISGRVVLSSKMPVIELLRLPLTGSLWDKRWLSGRGKTPTLCVFPVFSVSVIEKFCDACGDEKYYFLSGCLPSNNAKTRVASIAVDRSRWDIRRLSGRGKTTTLCVFPVFSMAVMEKFCDACGDGEYYFRSSISA